MPAFSFPILLWKDSQGAHYGGPVDGDAESVATGETASDVVRQLKDFLEWEFKEERRWGAPDFEDPRLEIVRIAVRPQTMLDDRTYPAAEDVGVEVPCVVGKRESGLVVCSVPLLGLEFDLHEDEEFRPVASERIRWALSGLKPAEVASLAAPPGLRVETIAVNVRVRPRREKPQPKLEWLMAVAGPVGAKEFRRRVSRAWRRDELVKQLAHRLEHEKSTVILVGPRGVGKTAVLIDAVRAAETGRVPPREPRAGEEPAGEERDADEARPAQRRRYWQTSAGRLIAGMKYLGEWEERVEGVIDELGNVDGVLCVENLLDLARTGGVEPSESVAAFLTPFLEHGEVRVVAEATADELDACRRLLPGFADCFQLVHVPEFDAATALSVMSHVAEGLTREFGVEPADDLLVTVQRLFGRFLPYRTFPGAAVEFLADLFGRVSDARRASERFGLSSGGARTSQRGTREPFRATPPAPPSEGGEPDQISSTGVVGVVTADDARRLFAQRTGLPERFLRDDAPLRAGDVFDALARRVIGQEHACRLAAEIIVTYKAGLNDPQRPVGVLLFCGPTGVGKTELAKAVSRYLFGHGDETHRLVRIDCSEYAGFGAAERLLTKPDGSPGHLIDGLRAQPFVVVLFDEIEKASDDVFDVLLNLLEEGRLTDRFGRTTFFRSALLVMTSNLGVRRGSSLGFAGAEEPNYERAILDHFRPEFVNRLDAIVPFHPLPREVILRIARKELAELAEREGIAASGLRLTFTDRLVERVADQGFDARLGARPLQRFLEEFVVRALSQHLVTNPGLRATSIQLDLGEGEESAIVIRATP